MGIRSVVNAVITRLRLPWQKIERRDSRSAQEAARQATRRARERAAAALERASGKGGRVDRGK
jgi:hypothetical protein